MARTRALLVTGLSLSLACSDDGGSTTADTSEATTESSASVGDGDPTAGDGDPTAGDGDPTAGDGDGDPTTGDGDGDPGDGDGDPGDGDGDPTTGDGDGDPNCADEETLCDGIDEDCDGTVDNVDVGMDGFCDCYRIGIIGNEGSNPSSNFAAWLEDKGTTAVRFGTVNNHQLTQQDLADIDILIVDRLTHVYSQNEAALLLTWLETGHGMISMAGYTGTQADIDQQNSLVSSSGLAYAMPLYNSPTEEWQNHPIAAGANGVQVYGGWQVVGAGEVFVRPQGEPNVSLGTAVTLMDGAAIVFSDEWISFDSEWQMIPQVETFWSNMIEWVGPKSFCADPQ